MDKRPIITDITLREKIRKAIDNKKLVSNDTNIHPLVLLLTHDVSTLPKGQFTEQFVRAILED